MSTRHASPVSLGGDEVRTYAALALRAVDGDGNPEPETYTELQGTAVPYEQWTSVGWFEEKMEKGVFRKSIREAAAKLPLLLWHNNATFPIGGARSWAETDDGLVGTWDLDPDDEQAQTAAHKANRGELVGMSVGFAPVNRTGAMVMVDKTTGEEVDPETWWRLEEPGVVWKEARLLEVSLTPTPAYAGAQVAMVRSAQRRHPIGNGIEPAPRLDGELQHWRRKLEGMRRAHSRSVS